MFLSDVLYPCMRQIVAFLRREAEQFSPFFIAEEESFDDVRLNLYGL